jgi:hypothetical protein
VLQERNAEIDWSRTQLAQMQDLRKVHGPRLSPGPNEWS